MWDLIVSVPDHCLSFYPTYSHIGLSQSTIQTKPNPHGALTRERYPTYPGSVLSSSTFQTSFLGNSE